MQDGLFNINENGEILNNKFGPDWAFEISPKEKFKELFYGCKNLSDQTKDRIMRYLEKDDFFTAPASTRFHGNYESGLVKHSIHVALKLKELTVQNNIKWDHEDSPIIIGLLHDVCKINSYKVDYKNVVISEDPVTHKKIWGKQPFYTFNDKNDLVRFGNHGDRSVTMLLMLRASSNDFTAQELTCIRYHMGFSQEGDMQSYSQAQNFEPNIMWTNIADNMAALTETTIK